MVRNNFSLGLLNVQNFHEASAAEAMRGVAKLDGVTTIPLYRATPDAKGITNPITGETFDGYQELGNHVGVMNTRTGAVTMTASNRYETIQHSEVFGHVLEAVDPLKEKTMISLENHGNDAELYILFPGMKVNDRADGMMPGVVFRNTYKHKDSFRGSFFGWRVRCLNGSIHSEAFGDLRLNVWHTAGHVSTVDEKIREFIEGMLMNCSKLELIIDAAANSEVKFKDYKEMANTLNPIVGGERRAEHIATSLPLTTTRWDIFNAITYEASHGDHISPGTRNRLMASAERNVLMVDTLAPVPMAA